MNTTDEAKQLVRFLRENGIKYAYVEETLRYERRKKYECKEFGKLLYCKILVKRGCLNILINFHLLHHLGND